MGDVVPSQSIGTRTGSRELRAQLSRDGSLSSSGTGSALNDSSGRVGLAMATSTPGSDKAATGVIPGLNESGAQTLFNDFGE